MSQARVKDRISALPDELLCKILSCLHIQCAVRTTVLSPRWKNLWTSLPNLRFCDKDFKNDREAFLTFVDRVLFFRDSSDIKKFHLDCRESEDDRSRIESWICTAIRRNVVELDLCVFMGNADELVLPRSLFTCKTLEVLILKSDFIVNPPKSGCFPSLKVLKVVDEYAVGLNNSSLGWIFSKCPLLEDLRFEGVLEADLNIYAPELKRLTVDMYLDDYRSEDYDFYVHAPKLEVFNLTASDSSGVSLEIKPKSLFKANIDLSGTWIEFDGTNGILQAFSNVKELSLSTLKLEGDVRVPAFDNLNLLELTIDCWRYLLQFLKRSRNLEYIIIKHSFGGKHEDFSPPKYVPICMLSHLKTITIRDFKGRQDETKVAQYLLKYSEVLKEMTVQTVSAGLSRAEENALYKEFLMFERGSKTCQVNFI